uniref:Uncharacterized protein n=1 Tax=Arundo donax TaxID=35708 RepID=A0A0A9GSE6_ARUDO
MKLRSGWNHHTVHDDGVSNSWIHEGRGEQKRHPFH